MTQINIPPNFLDVAITLSRSAAYAYGCRVDGDIIEFGTFRCDTARIITHGNPPIYGGAKK